MSGAGTIREFCLGVLEGGALVDKLRPPLTEDGRDLADPKGAPALRIDRPARDDVLRLHDGSEKLPRLAALRDPTARVTCLERFAHHELQAVELFAWALLAWPDLPGDLRRGLLGALADEQRHLRFYLDRLEALGGGLGDSRLSGYFWKNVPAIGDSPHGAQAFLCAMGLTLEQANLDFTLTYRDAFAAAGDSESAAALHRVHREEIAHVRLAADWLRRLSGLSDLEAYQRAVPFPFALTRAKGRRFDEAARRRAGLSAELIASVRAARPAAHGKPPSSS